MVSHVFSAERMEVDNTNNIQKQLKTSLNSLAYEDLIPKKQTKMFPDLMENERIVSRNFVLINLLPCKNCNIFSFVCLTSLLMVYAFAKTSKLGFIVKTCEAYYRCSKILNFICEHYNVPRIYLDCITQPS